MKEPARFSGTVIGREDPRYEDARRVWNAVPDNRPHEIMYCTGTEDVRAALHSALGRRLPFAARSGGHSMAGTSAVADGVVIDVSGLDSIELSDDASEVTAGSGARLGELYRTLGARGVTVPAGTCPKIGIGGHVLGGGMGILSRSRGPLIDYLVRLEMVDAAGNVLTVDEDSHPDLLWACRGGGGGNFGIVTSYTFRTSPVADITLFNLAWSWDDLAPALRAWQQWLATADSRINPFFAMFPRDQDLVATMGTFEGPPEEFSRLAEPLRAAATPSVEVIEEVPFLQAVDTIEVLQGEGAVATSVRAQGSSAMVAEPLDDRAIATLREYLTDPPSHRSEVAIYGMGGVIEDKSRTATAFVHRTGLMAFEYRTDWDAPEDDRKNLDWVGSLRHAMAPHTTGASYVNTVDLAVENWLWGYYQENLPRLMQVKAAYDPGDVFRHAHSIPVSLTAEQAAEHGIPEHVLAELKAAGRLH